jgi:hypothetical protein
MKPSRVNHAVSPAGRAGKLPSCLHRLPLCGEWSVKTATEEGGRCCLCIPLSPVASARMMDSTRTSGSAQHLSGHEPHMKSLLVIGVFLDLVGVVILGRSISRGL